MAEVDPVKAKIAQQLAKLFLHQAAAVQADVQLMAIEMLAKTVFTTGIIESKRLQLADRWLKSIREHVKADTKKRKV
jgi:hypothetical protein